MSAPTSDTPSSGVPVSPEVAAYAAAVEALAAAVAGGSLAEGCAVADLEVLHRAEAQVAAVKVARLDAVDRSEVWRDDGSKTVWAWLRRLTSMSEADARAFNRLRGQLSEFTLVADALAAGRISQAHAKVLGSSLTTLDRYALGTVWHTAKWLEKQEAAFLKAAETTDPGILRTELGKRLRALAPEPAAKDDEERHERRRASVTPGYDEMWDVDGCLDADGGQVLAAALIAYRRTDHSDGDTRTMAQRAADALVGIARYYLDTAGPQKVRGETAHLVITVPEARMAAWQTPKSEVTGRPLSCCELGQLTKLPCSHPPGEAARFPDPLTEPLFTGADGTLAPWTRDLPDREPVPTASWPNGQAVPEHVLARYLCGADLTRLVLDAQGQPLDVGRTRRQHTNAMWLAACEQWQQQCPTTGCHAPVHLLDMHHPIPWSEGGETSLDNALPLCGRCHTRVHHGHVLKLRDGRRLGPHGYLVTTAPPDQPGRPRRRLQTRRSDTLRAPASLKSWTCPGRDRYGPLLNGVATRVRSEVTPAP